MPSCFRVSVFGGFRGVGRVLCSLDLVMVFKAFGTIWCHKFVPLTAESMLVLMLKSKYIAISRRLSSHIVSLIY